MATFVEARVDGGSGRNPLPVSMCESYNVATLLVDGRLAVLP
jgi:hypothetical protein